MKKKKKKYGPGATGFDDFFKYNKFSIFFLLVTQKPDLINLVNILFKRNLREKKWHQYFLLLFVSFFLLEHYTLKVPKKKES